MRLEAIKEIKGKIILKSGLHIGAGDMEMKIGGIDNPVIKHPHTQEPYIPGSSLKGKVRSLLEMRSGLMAKTDGEPVSVKTLKACNGNGEKEACVKILKLFGSSGAETDPSLGPTRVSFADCPLDDKWKDKAREDHLSFTEVKSENSINRIKGTAENPRFSERVPSGAEFEFTVTLKQLNQNEGDLEDFLMEGLKLLQMDALGGSGSRGYGRIEFEFDDPKVQDAFEKATPLV
jgi:CRISPR-associated protein Csm3